MSYIALEESYFNNHVLKHPNKMVSLNINTGISLKLLVQFLLPLKCPFLLTEAILSPTYLINRTPSILHGLTPCWRLVYIYPSYDRAHVLFFFLLRNILNYLLVMFIVSFLGVAQSTTVIIILINKPNDHGSPIMSIL